MLSASAVLSLAHDGNTAGIITLCKQAILEEAAKKQGGSSLFTRTKAAQKLLKSVDDFNLPKVGAVVKTMPDGTTYQTFNNGYLGFALNAILQGLPQGDPEKCMDMWEYIQNTENQMKEREEVAVDLAAIKAHIVEQKALKNGKPIWKLGNHGYNAQYILDCFAVLGGDIKFYQDPTRPLSSAILESENGKGLLLPVRV